MKSSNAIQSRMGMDVKTLENTLLAEDQHRKRYGYKSLVGALWCLIKLNWRMRSRRGIDINPSAVFEIKLPIRWM